MLNLYIAERKTKDGKNKFNSYKSRNVNGDWIEVKFTEEAGKPKANFTLGENAKKGYVVIEVLSGNTSKKAGVQTKDGKPVWVMWVNSWKLADKKAQEAFKLHIEQVQKEYQAEQDEVFNSFVNGGSSDSEDKA